MRRRLTFPNKLFLVFVFGMIAMLAFLAVKNMMGSFAINAAYSGFQAGNIITDYVMGDYTSMSESDIQYFLKSKNPCNDTNVGKAVVYSSHTYHVANGHFVCMADESFNGESAAHIIWRAAQDYRINPKVLIVLLEKEQGLVTDTWPNADLQYRSATGYGCPDTAACDSTYYGFKNQIRNAAELFRYVLDHGSRYYPVGNNTIKYNPNGACGSSTVNIQNRATSALYQYTPYQPNAAVLNSNPGTVVNCGAYGNANFYYYYTKWFGDTHTSISSVFIPESDSFAFQASSGKYLIPSSNTSGARIVLSNNIKDNNQQYKLERSGDYYIIRHIKTDLVLDVISGQTTNGAGLQLFTFNDTCAQKWVITLSGGRYSFRSACAVRKAIDIPNNGVNTENIKAQLWDQNGTNAQSFSLVDLAAAPVNNGTYIINTLGNKTIDIVDGRTNNGTGIHTMNTTYSGNQQFIVHRGTDGLYTIKNVASNRVLDVAGGSKSDGASIQLYDSNNTCAQKWLIEKFGKGYSIRSECSGKAIDVPGGNISANFYRIQQYSFNGTNAQIWTFHTPNIIADGEYKISSLVGKNFVLDVHNGSAKDGTNVQIYTANGTNAQKFVITYDSGKAAYKISSAHANHVLDVSGAGKNNGTNVQIWNHNPATCAQFWRIQKNSDSTFTLVSTCSNKALDVSGGNASNHANVHIWEQNGTNAQKWKLDRL